MVKGLGLDPHAQFVQRTVEFSRLNRCNVFITFRDERGRWDPCVTYAEDECFYPFGQQVVLAEILSPPQDLPHTDGMLITKHGLILYTLDIPWIWAVHKYDGCYPEYRIGSAFELIETARASRVPIDRVCAVPAADIHGTCVFESNHMLLQDCPHAWGMVQAHGYRVAV